MTFLFCLFRLLMTTVDELAYCTERYRLASEIGVRQHSLTEKERTGVGGSHSLFSKVVGISFK